MKTNKTIRAAIALLIAIAWAGAAHGQGNLKDIIQKGGKVIVPTYITSSDDFETAKASTQKPLDIKQTDSRDFTVLVMSSQRGFFVVVSDGLELFKNEDTIFCVFYPSSDKRDYKALALDTIADNSGGNHPIAYGDFHLTKVLLRLPGIHLVSVRRDYAAKDKYDYPAARRNKWTREGEPREAQALVDQVFEREKTTYAKFQAALSRAQALPTDPQTYQALTRATAAACAGAEKSLHAQAVRLQRQAHEKEAANALEASRLMHAEAIAFQKAFAMEGTDPQSRAEMVCRAAEAMK